MHPAPESHHPTVAETPIGALPPISGGAPDSTAPESEIESAGDASSSEGDNPTAVATESLEPSQAAGEGGATRRSEEPRRGSSRERIERT